MTREATRNSKSERQEQKQHTTRGSCIWSSAGTWPCGRRAAGRWLWSRSVQPDTPAYRTRSTSRRLRRWGQSERENASDWCRCRQALAWADARAAACRSAAPEWPLRPTWRSYATRDVCLQSPKREDSSEHLWAKRQMRQRLEEEIRGCFRPGSRLRLSSRPGCCSAHRHPAHRVAYRNAPAAKYIYK